MHTSKGYENIVGSFNYIEWKGGTHMTWQQCHVTQVGWLEYMRILSRHSSEMVGIYENVRGLEYMRILPSRWNIWECERVGIYENIAKSFRYMEGGEVI